MAHRVNGIPIVQAYSWGRAFGRIDLDIDTARRAGAVVASTVHAPTPICARVDPATGACATDAPPTSTPARYEGREVRADARITEAMAPAMARVAAVRARPLGAVLPASVSRLGAGGESPLGHLFAEAIRGAVPGATIGLSYGAGPGGLRADLEAGPVTTGALYDVFPFDNAVEAMWFTGAQLARVVDDHLSRPRWGARSLGLAGLRVTVTCDGTRPSVSLVDDAGRPLAAEARMLVALPDFLAARARRAGVGAAAAVDPPVLVREAAEQWVRRARPVVPSSLTGRWRVADDTSRCTAP
ncbi:MAG: 5'-nucleotidase C-terminal domain-containing protein [Vicinamibacterales bacterium]